MTVSSPVMAAEPRGKCERLSKQVYYQPVAAEMINHTDQQWQTQGETRGRCRPPGRGSVRGRVGEGWERRCFNADLDRRPSPSSRVRPAVGRWQGRPGGKTCTARRQGWGTRRGPLSAVALSALLEEAVDTD